MRKKILLSGGWGYGNLGDDAILHASLKLIGNTFQDAEISIFSYEPIVTSEELKNKFKVYPSPHRLLFGDSAFKQLSIYGKVAPQRNTIFHRVKRRLEQYAKTLLKYNDELLPNRSNLQEIEVLFATADIFIMSGGGYFNNWKESLISRIEELRLAQKYNVPSYIIGQSLDNFRPEYQDTLQSLLSKCHSISVRDEKSLNVLSNMGVSAILSPDLVLSGLDFKRRPLSKGFVFVPAELPLNNRDNIIEGVYRYALKREIPVRIAITRLYNADIIHAKYCVKYLEKRGVRVNFRIPKSFDDVYADIVGANLIFSRNLHGLILGYIGGGKVLSLNNQWKFTGFLNQIEFSKAIVDAQTATPEHIVAKLSKIQECSIDDDIRIQLSETVENNFSKMFRP